MTTKRVTFITYGLCFVEFVACLLVTVFFDRMSHDLASALFVGTAISVPVTLLIGAASGAGSEGGGLP